MDDTASDKVIQSLNETVLCTLRPSNIHGIGVFTIRDVKKGELMYCKEYVRTPLKIPTSRLKEIREEVRKIILERWPTIEKGGHFLSPNEDTRLISFMNHQSKPNYDKYTDKAKEDIPRHTEVTEDYGEFALPSFNGGK